MWGAGIYYSFWKKRFSFPTIVRWDVLAQCPWLSNRQTAWYIQRMGNDALLCKAGVIFSAHRSYQSRHYFFPKWEVCGGHPMLAGRGISKRSITQKEQMKCRLTAMLCGMKVILKDNNWSHQDLAFGISKWREIIWINYQMGNTLVMKVPLIGSSLRLIWKNGFGHSSNLTNKSQWQRLRQQPRKQLN